MSKNLHHRGSARLRIGRHSESGRCYLVTWATDRRQPHLRNFASARCVIQTLIHSDSSKWTSTLAYVVMPDHLHWLFELTDRRPLSSVVASVKRYSAHRIHEQTPGHFHVWQMGFHDHAVRREEDLLSTSRYICANPLRSGLCQSLSDYPHWDAVWLTS